MSNSKAYLIEKIDLRVFHHTEGNESLIQIQEILLKIKIYLFKNSKKLHDLKLNLGDIAYKDDYYGQVYSVIVAMEILLII